jgi:hypothetical protein
LLVIKTLDPDWIRIWIGIQPKMLDPDPDPYQMNMDQVEASEVKLLMAVLDTITRYESSILLWEKFSSLAGEARAWLEGAESSCKDLEHRLEEEEQNIDWEALLLSLQVSLFKLAVMPLPTRLVNFVCFGVLYLPYETSIS